jgi:nucleotide-binding universal stress UspA family protein
MSIQTTAANADVVLVGVDRSAASAAAVRWAAVETLRRGGRLHAVHVVDHSRRHDARCEADTRLELTEARHTVPVQVGDLLFRAGLDPDATVRVVCGEVEGRLAYEARGADLVVIGAPDGPEQATLPSRLAQGCHCPVAVVTADGDVTFVESATRQPEGASHART